MTTPKATEMKFLAAVDLSWLTEAAQHLLDDKKSALQLYCWAKRIEEKMKEVQAALIITANAEFTQVREASNKLTKWPYEEFAVLTNNAGRGSWSYSPDIMAKQAEVDELVKQFQAAHKTTHYVEGRLDASKTALFKVSIMR